MLNIRLDVLIFILITAGCFSPLSCLASLNDGSEETFFDPGTGLIWQQQTAGPMPWLNAVHYCNQLDSAQMKGWRLPYQGEFLEANFSALPAVKTSAETTLAEADFFWVLGEATGQGPVLAIDIATGEVLNSEETSAGGVRCVVETVEAVYLPLLRKWAEAWASQDFAAYLDCYGAAYMPEDVESRKQWEQNRRKRINAPKQIQIDLSDIKVLAEREQQADIVFMQSYRADHYQDKVMKIVTIGLESGVLKIIGEKVIAQVR